jgi:hypothetical protein
MSLRDFLVIGAVAGGVIYVAIPSAPAPTSVGQSATRPAGVVDAIPPKPAELKPPGPADRAAATETKPQAGTRVASAQTKTSEKKGLRHRVGDKSKKRQKVAGQ